MAVVDRCHDIELDAPSVAALAVPPGPRRVAESEGDAIIAALDELFARAFG